MSLKKAKQFTIYLASILSYRCLFLSIAAVAATWLCVSKSWTADYPMTLIGTAVIFPIVFSINSAYQRRELSLLHYAKMKSNLRALYFAMRNWNGPLPAQDLSQTRQTIAAPLYAVRALITQPSDEMRQNEGGVYRAFSDLSYTVETHVRRKAFTGAESSACQSYLNTVMSEFEGLKHIYQYRTPRALQAFSDVFITVLPILYAPVFAAIALKIQFPYLAYMVPALFAFVLTSLDKIQADLEDPFDGIGVDDIVINAEVFLASLDDGISVSPHATQSVSEAPWDNGYAPAEPLSTAVQSAPISTPPPMPGRQAAPPFNPALQPAAHAPAPIAAAKKRSAKPAPGMPIEYVPGPAQSSEAA